MKRYVLIGITGVLLLLIIGLVLKGKIFSQAKAGLKVTSTPTAAVFLDGDNLGQTPFEKDDLSPGKATIRLVPEAIGGDFAPWEAKIELLGKTQTIVNREFGETEALSAGEIITLEKITDKENASLAVTSFPDSSMVKLNNEPKGFTPISLSSLSEGEREVVVSAPGFTDRTIRIKLLPGFKLILNVKLIEVPEGEEGSEGEEGDEESDEEPSGEDKSPEATPTKKPSVKDPERPFIEIKDTPTGWLRVRMGPSTSATEAAKVNPGEKYELLDEESGWYKINYEEKEEGWVAGQYAEKYE